MDNIFEQNISHSDFSWDRIGDIKGGRGSLGEEMPVLVYRLMQYTMLDVMSKDLGLEKANEFFYKAGFLAGTEYAANVLDLSVDFDSFISDLQRMLKEHKIGILRLESVNEETGEMILTVGEDLDCSGLPITNENVCIYDEGFIAGILHKYTGKTYNVTEIDCWASGDRVCRFRSELVND